MPAFWSSKWRESSQEWAAEGRPSQVFHELNFITRKWLMRHSFLRSINLCSTINGNFLFFWEQTEGNETIFYVPKLNPQNQLDLFSIFREFIHGPENFMGFISRRAKVYLEGAGMWAARSFLELRLTDYCRWSAQNDLIKWPGYSICRIIPLFRWSNLYI